MNTHAFCSTGVSSVTIPPSSSLRIALDITMAHDFPPLKNDLILRTAWGQDVERAPIWIMRQAGRYLPEYHEAKGGRDFFECCRDPEVASTLTLQPIERFEGLLDASIIFSDILVIPQAMGMAVEMIDKKGPHFPQPLTSPDDGQYSKVLEKNVDVAAELDYVYKAITLTRKKLNGRVPLIGFCGAPWTLLCYMVGNDSKTNRESKTWIYKYAEASRAMLQKISEVCVEYLALQVKAGAQLIQVFDSNAGELSPSAFKVFSEPYLAYIAKHLPLRLKEMGLERVPMIVFPKGATAMLDSACDLGYNVVGLDWCTDPAEAVKIRGNRPVVFQGNADPAILYGTHENITSTVEHMVKGFGGGKKGWVANLGHGITPWVKPDDLRFYLSEVQRLSSA
ncbi:uroporphyrinogen decarboxylase [Seiridium cupressi]|uniref:Uroporphyrinogen decarboxylase n=1 Tax=Seiridium unicorne TaxID=138068 RepID=A0ABR2V5R1_9PEZI